MVLAESFGMYRGKPVDLVQRLLVAAKPVEDVRPQLTRAQHIGMALAEGFGLDRGKPVDVAQRLLVAAKPIEDVRPQLTRHQHIGMALAGHLAGTRKGEFRFGQELPGIDH